MIKIRCDQCIREEKTHGSLDVLASLAGGKDGIADLGGGWDGDDLRAVDESAGVVTEDGKLSHDGLELGHHETVVSCSIPP